MQERQNHSRLQWFDRYCASKTVLFWACTDRCWSVEAILSFEAARADPRVPIPMAASSSPLWSSGEVG